ncbi:MAG: hypothetical protein ACI9R3_005336 [Verrucomicrobiales bacterium]|jgi:hypothetical protein
MWGLRRISGNSAIPMAGTNGDVLVGDPNSNRIFKQWRAVNSIPEPSTAMLIVSTLAILGFTSRRRS